MVKYGDALKKPFTDLKKLIIGILLHIIPIVDFTIVYGFQMECSGLGKNKPSKQMPKWKEWKYLFMKGLGAVGIKIVYMLPAIILIGIGIMIAAIDIIQMIAENITPEIFYQISNNPVAAEMFGQVFWMKNGFSIIATILKISPIFIAGGILFLLAKFLSPLAILNYLKKRKFSAAFEFGTILKKAFTMKYILSCLALLAVAVVLGSILLFIPFIGMPALAFMIGVMGYSLFGQVYKETK